MPEEADHFQNPAGNAQKFLRDTGKGKRNPLDFFLEVLCMIDGSMDFSISIGHVEDSLRDSGIERRNVHDIVLVGEGLTSRTQLNTRRMPIQVFLRIRLEEALFGQVSRDVFSGTRLARNAHDHLLSIQV